MDETDSPVPPGLLPVVGAAILDGDRCLVARRGPSMSAPGRWEFPGGKVERGEDPRAALVREIREELGIEIAVGPLLGRGIVAEPPICLDVYEASRTGGQPELREHQDTRWIAAVDIDQLDWADADVPILAALRRRLEQ